MLYGGNHLVWHTGNCQSCTKRMFFLGPTARGWQGGSNAMSSLSPPCYLLLSTQTGVSGYTHTMTQYTILSQRTGNKTEECSEINSPEARSGRTNSVRKMKQIWSNIEDYKEGNSSPSKSSNTFDLIHCSEAAGSWTCAAK